MPEMHFRVEWPDGKQIDYYSPSLVVKKYFEEGGEYPVDEFVEKARESLNIASDRVKAKYGFACGRAMGSLQQIEQVASAYGDAGQAVRVIRFTSV
ncbi:MAG: MSMEG_0570 family nitrogen starvation response protein [Cyanobacteria bacterium P01_A01_bin.3]